MLGFGIIKRERSILDTIPQFSHHSAMMLFSIFILLFQRIANYPKPSQPF